MDYIHTETGGFKTVLDDLDYIQASVKNHVKGYIAYLAERQPSFVFQGCEITTTNNQYEVNITPGWVVVAGELLRFEGATIQLATQEQKMKFERVELDNTIIPASNKVKDDNTTYFAYKTVQARLTIDLSGDVEIDSSYYSSDDGLNHWYTIHDVLSGKLKKLTASAGWALSSRVFARKDISGFVHISGNALGSGNATGSQLATIPTGYAPAVDTWGNYVTGSKVYPALFASSGVVLVSFGSDNYADGHFVITPYKTA